MSVTPGTPDSLQAVFSLVPALVCLSPFNSCAFALARRRCMLSGRFGWDVWHGWWPTGYCLRINKPGFPLLRASLCFACSIFYRSRCELRAFISRILFHTWWHFFFFARCFPLWLSEGMCCSFPEGLGSLWDPADTEPMSHHCRCCSSASQPGPLSAVSDQSSQLLHMMEWAI